MADYKSLDLVTIVKAQSKDCPIIVRPRSIAWHPGLRWNSTSYLAYQMYNNNNNTGSYYFHYSGPNSSDLLATTSLCLDFDGENIVCGKSHGFLCVFKADRMIGTDGRDGSGVEEPYLCLKHSGISPVNSCYIWNGNMLTTNAQSVALWDLRLGKALKVHTALSLENAKATDYLMITSQFNYFLAWDLRMFRPFWKSAVWKNESAPPYQFDEYKLIFGQNDGINLHIYC
jgi:hypothetical protein